MRLGTLSLLSIIALVASGPQAVAATPEAEIERVLAMQEAPSGVVFEVVSGDPDALTRIVPRVSAYSERLRARFPGLPVAVVTHGSEQFSLLASEADSYSELHAQVRSLSGEQNIDVHVCGTHASWRDKHPEDFPDYVDVAVAAPAKVNDYRALGYIVILF